MGLSCCQHGASMGRANTSQSFPPLGVSRYQEGRIAYSCKGQRQTFLVEPRGEHVPKNALRSALDNICSDVAIVVALTRQRGGLS
jgi:hypothetical protein